MFYQVGYMEQEHKSSLSDNAWMEQLLAQNDLPLKPVPSSCLAYTAHLKGKIAP